MTTRTPIITVLGAALLVACGSTPNAGQSVHKWTAYVPVEGQADAVPIEWLSTPEGKFAHSIKLPDAVSRSVPFDFDKAKVQAALAGKPSVSEQYFQHLCASDAGDYIFRTVEKVEGLYFVRPPNRPTDDDLMDRYKLEAPGLERTFQLMPANPEERGKLFVNPPWQRFSFVEEPNHANSSSSPFVRVYGYSQRVSAMKSEFVNELKSKYALVWRGINRPHDRELGISGGEWIVFDLATKEVLAVERDYARTGMTRNTPDGMWWLNAVSCPDASPKTILGSQVYVFVTKSLKPPIGDK